MTWYEKFNNLDIDELKDVVANEYTYKHVIEHFGFNFIKSNSIYRVLKRVMDENRIDYSHFGYKKLKDLSEQLIKDSHYNNQTLKKRLLKEGYLTYKCAICGNKGIMH